LDFHSTQTGQTTAKARCLHPLRVFVDSHCLHLSMLVRRQREKRTQRGEKEEASAWRKKAVCASHAPEEGQERRDESSLKHPHKNNQVAQGVVAYGSQALPELLYMCMIIACTKASACLSCLPSVPTCFPTQPPASPRSKFACRLRLTQVLVCNQGFTYCALAHETRTRTHPHTHQPYTHTHYTGTVAIPRAEEGVGREEDSGTARRLRKEGRKEGKAWTSTTPRTMQSRTARYVGQRQPSARVGKGTGVPVSR
jgi:hypothetical protein